MVEFKFKLLHLAFFRRPFGKRNTADTVLLMGLLVNMVCAVELLVVFYRMVSSSIDFMRQLGDFVRLPRAASGLFCGLQHGVAFPGEQGFLVFIVNKSKPFIGAG